MNRICFLLCACLLALVVLAGCRDRKTPAEPETPAAPPWFEDVTHKVGVSFLHDAGPVDGRFFMPQSVGSGVALFDADGDGRLDIYLIHNGGPKGKKNQFYRQQASGVFEDVSAASGLDVAGFGMGVAIGDVDNDGRPDVLLTEYGRVRLFVNEGQGRFRDVSDRAGLENPLWACSAAFLDADADGWLDLVVVNYVDYDPSWPCVQETGVRDYCAPRVFPGTVSKLFRNLKKTNPPRFADVTVAAGLNRATGPGLGVVCADFDGDGQIDIFIANDGAANHLWINRQGSFKEEAVMRGLAYNGMGVAQAGMGVAIGDVDGNGLFDLFVTHLASERHTLWLQQPRGLFRDRTRASGLAGSHWRGTGFGTALADFDHDGNLDIVVVNGAVARLAENANPDLGPHWGWYAQRNQLFSGADKGMFHDLSRNNPALCGQANVARGLAVGDLDNDGAVDLVVTTIAGPVRVLRNVAGKKGHWLIVRALDSAKRRDVPGASIRVIAADGTWWRQINPAASFLSSHDPRAHFGLGPTTRLERLEVTWPGGNREVFPGGAVDRVVELVQGKGSPP